MSYLEEDKTAGTPDSATEAKPEAAPQPASDANAAPKASPPPAGEYWVRGNVGQIGQQRPTNPHGYGQGYQPLYAQPPVPPQGSQLPQAPYGPPQGYQAYGQQPPYRQPGQHQYSANTGWQQTPPRPPENYQWNFEDYDRAAAGKAGKKRSRGLVVFVVSMVCVMAVSIVGLAAYGIYGYISENGADGNTLADPSVGSAAPDGSSRAAAPLELAQKPQISETLPVGGKLTAEQVADAVTPSVVGVVQYQPGRYLNETGEGSGIIMSEDGYVITNEHVVAGGDVFKVLMADGTPYDAELIASDIQTDLAVLKIKGVSGLTPAVFGDSTQVKVGEWAFVIGNPGGKLLAGSMTRGIISAVNRDISGKYTIPLIQTDAAINPGNSGGALVNEYGQVIGIPSAKIVAEGFEGICFAIPISEAKPIIDDMVANRRVTGRVKLGIEGKAIDEIDARNYGLMEGIYILEINEDSDLNNTSVQRFDIITHIDDERVTDMTSLQKVLNRYSPGDRVTLTIFRSGAQEGLRTFTVQITLQEKTD